MPTRLEAHAKLQGFTQNYSLYRTDDTYYGGQASASVGSRAGAFSWWIALSHLTSDAQPMSFVVKNVPATTSAAGTPVTGAFADRNPREVRATCSARRSRRDAAGPRQAQARLRLHADAARLVHVRLVAQRRRPAVDSFLRDASGRR
jgi:iron complex outermembrane receptor protein